MMGTGRRWASLALLISAAAAALASSRLGLSPWAGLLVLPILPARLPAIGAGPLRALPRLLRALLLAALLFGLVWALYPVIPPGMVRIVPILLGGSLLALAVIFFLGRSSWDPDPTALPAALGALAVAAFNPDAAILVPLGIAAAAVFVYLLRPPLRLGPLLAFAVPALALAAGVVSALPWAQPKVEDVAASLLNAGMGGSGLNLDSTTRLGDVQRLSLSRRVAMRVSTPRAQKLRARVFTRFDGARWMADAPDLTRELVDAVGVPDALASWLAGLPGRSLADPAAPLPEAGVPTKVLQLVPNDRVLLAPAGVRLVRVAAAGVSLDKDDLVVPQRRSRVEIYGLVNDPSAAGGPEPGPDLLAVPEDTDPRLRELARQLAFGATPAERVRRTTFHLGRECRYSLEPGRFRTRQPVAEFVFEKKQGYCEYFASAAALLLRLQGLPTRYVIGFNVPGAEFTGGHYVVRDSDAHAWIEAYLPGRGFVEVDPTPADQYAAAHAEHHGGFAPWEWLRARWSELTARVRSGDLADAVRFVLGRLGLPILVAALVFLALRFLRRKRRPPLAGPRPDPGLPPELARLLARLDQHWRRQGAPRPASRAPLEHLESLPHGRSGGDASRRVVETLYSARFAGRAVGSPEVEALVRLLDEGGIR